MVVTVVARPERDAALAETMLPAPPRWACGRCPSCAGHAGRGGVGHELARKIVKRALHKHGAAPLPRAPAQESSVTGAGSGSTLCAAATRPRPARSGEQRARGRPVWAAVVAGAPERCAHPSWRGTAREGDGVRMNEGGCDPDGRFYCGSIAYDQRPGAGSLYRRDPDRSAHVVLTGVKCPTAWSGVPTAASLTATTPRRIRSPSSPTTRRRGLTPRRPVRAWPRAGTLSPGRCSRAVAGAAGQAVREFAG